jgi:RNAse (barnase) inhibitor barstar
MALAERLTALAPPWAHVAVLARGQVTFPLPELPPRFVSRTLDGRRCATKGQLMDEFARAFAFPVYFGRTWDAVEDCLTDLTWLPGTGYVLLMTRAEQTLRDQPGEYRMLIDLLESVGRAWATGTTGHPDRGPVSFHSVLVVSEHDFVNRPDWRLPRISP